MAITRTQWQVERAVDLMASGKVVIFTRLTREHADRIADGARESLIRRGLSTELLYNLRLGVALIGGV